MERPTIHVAIAEDLPLTMSAIINTLEANRDIVVQLRANDGAAMLEKLIGAEQLPDICIIDINMPIMNGYALLTQIKRQWPAMRTLVYTIHQSQEAIEDMLKRGANGYVLKHSDPKELVDAVYDIYHNGHHYNKVANEKLFIKIRTREIKVKGFSPKDMEVIRLISQGLTYREIAETMRLSISAIHNYRDRLFDKFIVSSRQELITKATQCGLIDF